MVLTKPKKTVSTVQGISAVNREVTGGKTRVHVIYGKTIRPMTKRINPIAKREKNAVLTNSLCACLLPLATSSMSAFCKPRPMPMFVNWSQPTTAVMVVIKPYPSLPRYRTLIGRMTKLTAVVTMRDRKLVEIASLARPPRPE